MSGAFPQLRRVPRFVLAVLVPLVVGCAGSPVYIHDESKATSSSEARSKYEQIEVTKILEAENENLNGLLEQELAAVRANRQLRFELELLRMAADERMAMTHTAGAIGKRLKSIGFDGIADVRAYRERSISREGLEDDMSRSVGNIHGIRPALEIPNCQSPMPELDLAAQGVSAFEQAAIETDYDDYKSSCTKWLATFLPPKEGLVLETHTDWQVALNQIIELRAEIKAGNKAAANAAREKAAIEADAKKSPGNHLIESAEDLNKKLALAIKFANAAGIEIPAQAKVDAIGTILSAIAGDDLGDAAQPGTDLANAVAVADQLPTLADDVAKIRNLASAPSVVNFLIELRHQQILVAHAKTRLGLAETRAQLFEERHKAVVDEAGFLKEQYEHLCNYAELQSGNPWPGISCDKFEAFGNDIDDAGCVGVSGSTLTGCALEKTWKEALAQSTFQPGAERELYAALAAWTRVNASRSRFIELEYRLIDLEHREALAANQLALDAWNNLITASIDGLAGYYEGGIRPEEVADLIVKALGFVTIGVLADD